MQVMTAKQAKTHFGELIISVQREPVVITKNNKVIGAFVSIDDLKDTPIAERLLQPKKTQSNAEWVKLSLQKALAEFDKNGSTDEEATDEFYSSVMEQIKSKFIDKKF